MFDLQQRWLNQADRVDSDGRAALRRRRQVRVYKMYVIIFIMWGAGWFWFNERVQVEMTRIRAQGFPVTGAELNAWYPYPEGANAADVYAQAFAAYPKDETTYSGRLRFERWDELPRHDQPLAADLAGDIEVYLQANAERMRLLRQATAIESCRFPVDLSMGMFFEARHLGELRTAALLMKMEAMLHLHQDRPLDALANVEQIFRLADALKNEPTLISHLVRNSLDALAVATLERILPYVDDQGGRLLQLDGELSARIDPNALVRALAGERVTVLAFFRPTGPRSGHEDSMIVAGKLVTATGVFMPEELAFLKTMQQNMDAAARVTDRNSHRR